MSLALKSKNLDSSKGLVKISTTCFLDGMNFISKFLSTTKSQIKWKLISTYFIIACIIGFVARYLELMILIKRTGACVSSIFSSFNKDYSQTTSVDARERALYSTLTIEHVTTLCMDEYHEALLSPK